MRGAKAFFAGAFLVAGVGAQAAEPPPYYPSPPPPPVLKPICVPRAQAYMWPGVPLCAEEEFGKWYLRGDIGMTNQWVDHLDNVLYAGNSIDSHGYNFTSSPLFGAGIGFEVNDWLRFDLTGEYRGKAEFNGLDIVNASFTDEYTAKKSELLFLLNGYVDLGTWWCITPFVGAGVGFDRVTIGSFLDVNTPNNGVAFGATASQWNFAWAVQAGVAYQVTPNWTAEFSYRFVSLGDGITGDLTAYDGTNDVNNPMHFKGLYSNDFKLGLRWTCCESEAPPPPPPPMVYQPPVYAPPPPIVSKG
ncbi:MAG TPA: outer membrane beta-barrel protein [Xanthobacteraceae bacterium]|nr:outer membrane beta-barrel protein [Xanthobacteraceae bacterium]